MGNPIHSSSIACPSGCEGSGGPGSVAAERRGLPPLWEISPPLRPAAAASCGLALKDRFSGGTLAPPFRAISDRFSRLIAAKPLCAFLGESGMNSSACLSLINRVSQFHEDPPRLQTSDDEGPLSSVLRILPFADNLIEQDCGARAQVRCSADGF